MSKASLWFWNIVAFIVGCIIGALEWWEDKR